jgi:hypothetical protein
MNPEKRTVKGKVTEKQQYAFPTRHYYLFVGTAKAYKFKKHRNSPNLSFSKFLTGFQGKKVKLTLEEIQ